MKKIALALILATQIALIVNGQEIKKSSIFSAGLNTLQDRNDYNITNIAWGFLPFGNIEGNHQTFVNQATMTQNEGRTFHGRVEFDAGWQNFVDYCETRGVTYAANECKNIENKGFEYWWFANAQYKGLGPNWMSSHSPIFKDFLKYQIDKVLDAPVDVVMMDAQTSSALACKPYHNGDFSSHSITAFRAYLKDTYTNAELANMGIDNINTFNYRTFLNDAGITTDAVYLNRITQANNLPPLYEIFQLFQSKAVNELTAEMAAYAKSIRPDVVFGTSSPLQDPFRATVTSDISYYMLEAHMDDYEYDITPILSYKYGEALNSPIILTSLPDAWEDIVNGVTDEEEGLEWITTAYAHGANFIMPINQWAFGSTYYNPTIDGYEQLSNFISNNYGLFDNYSSKRSKVALVISREAIRKNNFEVNDIAAALDDYSIPYNLVTIGDEFLEGIPTANELSAYEKVIVPENVYNWFLSDEPVVKGLLDDLGDKLFMWEEDSPNSVLGPLKADLSTKFNVKAGADFVGSQLHISPRTASPEMDYILHITNHNYNNGNQAFTTYEDVTVKFDKTTFEEEVTGAKLYQPGKAPITLTVSTTGNKTLVEGIDELNLWGVLQLQHDDLITSQSEEISKHIAIYPNPAINEITIKGIDANQTWEITNTIGVRTLTGKGTSVDISSLQKGIYLIHFGEHAYSFVK